jgi:hypothetical protein
MRLLLEETTDALVHVMLLSKGEENDKQPGNKGENDGGDYAEGAAPKPGSAGPQRKNDDR